ncbi:MAG: ATP-binding protein [bacterium]|nr:ATP-binding protein [bacterium]
MRIYIKLVIIFLAFAIIPVMFVSNLVFNNSKNIIEKEILSKLSIINNEEKSGIETFFNERKQDLLLMEQLDIYKTHFRVLDQFYKDRSNPSYINARKEVDQRFAVSQLTQSYIDIKLTNIDGKIIYVFDTAFEPEIGNAIPNKDDVFQQSKNGIYVGELHKTINKRYSYNLFLAAPAYDNANKVIGLIYLELDMVKWFKFIQDNSELGKSLETIIVKKTPDNKVIFLSPLKYQQEAISAQTINIGGEYGLPAQKSALGETGSGLTIDYRGKEVLSVWLPIEDLGWGLVSKIDSEEAFLPVDRLKKLLIVVILITIFSTALAVFTIAKSISDPIQELQKGAEIIGKGNLDYQIGNDSRDEIGQLSREFDKMTKNIRETTTSLDILNKEVIERKKAEEHLNQSLKQEVKSREILLSMLADNNLIREKLEKHIEELKRAKNILIRSEKMASLGKLVSEIAHEFNNPLMIISGNAQVSLMSGPLSDEVKRNLQIIIEESQRAKNIIRRLLKFSRPSKGEVKEVDINMSIDTIVNIVEQQLKLANVEIIRDYQKDLSVSVNEQQMQEVFMNLISNAKDSMPDGGTITIKTSQEEDYLRIDFRDTGCGMSEEVKNKIFNPFFTTKEEGTGLGLIICLGIIEVHKGELKLESELNKGTTFTILLPMGDKA